MQNLYEEYALLEAEISVLEMKKEQLKPVILQQMIDGGVDKIETIVGKFSVSTRKTWTYPVEVNEIGEEFKAAKAKAESTNEATFEQSTGLRFTSIKL